MSEQIFGLSTYTSDQLTKVQTIQSDINRRNGSTDFLHVIAEAPGFMLLNDDLIAQMAIRHAEAVNFQDITAVVRWCHDTASDFLMGGTGRRQRRNAEGPKVTQNQVEQLAETFFDYLSIAYPTRLGT